MKSIPPRSITFGFVSLVRTRVRFALHELVTISIEAHDILSHKYLESYEGHLASKGLRFSFH